MKLYFENPAASTRMIEDKALGDLLAGLASDDQVQGVIETGTFDGLGSTALLASSFKSKKPRFFYTCEVDFLNYLKARKNLIQYPFVKCLWGLSVRLNEASQFLQNDQMLKHHEDYPELYIDHVQNPVAFYEKECRGEIFSRRKGFRQNIHYSVMKMLHHRGEDLLRRLLSKHAAQKPLILLDSAGGVGYLEFKVVDAIMQNQPYWLLLDDIHHIKHARTFEQVKADERFNLVGFDLNKGWALAQHQPVS